MIEIVTVNFFCNFNYLENSKCQDHPTEISRFETLLHRQLETHDSRVGIANYTTNYVNLKLRD